MIGLTLQDMKTCLEAVNERHRQVQREQINQFAVLAGASGSGTGLDADAGDLEGALDDEADDIMVKAKKPAGKKKNNKRKGKGGKGRRS